ncbi:hypothetical protein BDV25DRAFT_87742 [Aspergillus avenaceus]|uniref:Uncharacterized protein n=1 Tax=Aspergillus avenaceus TaxID=36643 RepID=A0A5N6U0F4_ASPAV|nr:hypothetical protein BDV25DRAFT_87742 [Aspergillus avenaceus]
MNPIIGTISTEESLPTRLANSGAPKQHPRGHGYCYQYNFKRLPKHLHVSRVNLLGIWSSVWLLESEAWGIHDYEAEIPATTKSLKSIYEERGARKVKQDIMLLKWNRYENMYTTRMFPRYSHRIPITGFWLGDNQHISRLTASLQHPPVVSSGPADLIPMKLLFLLSYVHIRDDIEAQKGCNHAS